MNENQPNAGPLSVAEALRDVRAELRDVDPVDGVVEAAHAFVLAAAIERVRALHRRHDDDPGGPAYCAECTSEYAPWPCPTVRALDGDQTGDET